MNKWYVIKVNTDDVRIILITTSYEKAQKSVEDNEDIENGTYCYICNYKGGN